MIPASVAHRLKRAFVALVHERGERLRLFSTYEQMDGAFEFRFVTDTLVGPVSAAGEELVDTTITYYTQVVRFARGELTGVSPSQLDHLAHSVWSGVVEDELVRAEEEQARLRIVELSQSGAHGDVLMAAMDAYRGIREHRRRHHDLLETRLEIDRRESANELRMRQAELEHRMLYGTFAASDRTRDSVLTEADIHRAIDALRGNERDRRADQLAAFEYIVGMRHMHYGSEPWSKEAKERGEKLLREHLTPQQRAELEKDGHFHVIGCDTRKTYRITRGRQMNVFEIDSAGKKVCGWCFLPGGNLCEGDTMLGQKIALECEEPAALAIANKFAVGGGISARAMAETLLGANGIRDPGRYLNYEDLV